MQPDLSTWMLLVKFNIGDRPDTPQSWKEKRKEKQNDVVENELEEPEQ